MDCENAIERKTREEIKKLQIDNNKAMNNLIDKKVTRSMLEVIAQSVVEAFADLPRPQAIEIADIFNMPDKVDEIEKLLAVRIVDSLNEVGIEINKKIKDYA